MRTKTTTLAGTATLSALVVVLDYTVKYSNLKIVFPLLPYLRFDFTGIPIVLSGLLFGFVPGMTTSVVASLAILARSGDVVGSSMKGLAEFSTMLGLLAGLALFNRFKAVGSSAVGIFSRVFVMLVANWMFVFAGLLSLGSSWSNVPLLWTLLVSLFNVAQGTLTVVGGFSVYEAIKRRAPTLVVRPQ